MKRILYFTVAISIIIIAFCVYSVYYLEASAQGLLKELEKVDKDVREENWEQVKESLKHFTKRWEKEKFMWSILINHAEIDNIEVSIAHIKSYLSQKDLSEIRAEIEGLFLYLKHIPETEKLTLENIL